MPVKRGKYSLIAGGLLLFFLQAMLFGSCIQLGNRSSSRGSSPALGEGDSSRSDTLSAERSSSSATSSAHADSLRQEALGGDSLAISVDSLLLRDSLWADSTAWAADSLTGADSGRRYQPFLEEVITGKNRDSLVYDVKNGKVYIYQQGDVTYQQMNLKADYITMDMDTKMIYANGVPDDSTGLMTRPIFLENGTEYTMDTINYNINSAKAKIKGVWTQEGEGYLSGGVLKKMPDNTINIAHGRYTTCDADHPHFYLEMTKAKAYPGRKAVFGYSYMVMEDVPLYFLGLPFGFFPLNSERSSGFIVPSFGEQALKGFFLRDGGYYYAPNDYIDMTFLGGIYTMGSWELKQQTRYNKRYHYSGNFSINYASEKFGDKGSADFNDMRNFRLQWSHTMDPKASQGSTFSASVNFSTSGYNKYSSNNLSDYITNQTMSSISYSKNWAGTPFSFSTNLSHSQSNRDSTVSLGFPNFSLNMSRVYPFRRKEPVGKQRWYEKIAMTYSGTFQNSVTVKEDELFKDEMFDKMKMGMNHNIPVTASFTLFNYINLSPNFNYQERWYFDKIHKEWDPELNQVVTTDTTRGFYRVYNYSYSLSASTMVYGMYNFTKGGTKDPKIQAIRHVMSPSIGFGLTPSFGGTKYGYYEPIQLDSTGRIGYYSPYEQGVYGVPGQGRSAAMSFSLGNTLEAKVKSDQDTTGYKKVKILDNLSFSGSYNFLADSLNLSLINVQLRSTLIKNFGINLNMVFDPYQVDPKTGQRINRFYVQDGKLARLVSVGTSFGWSHSFGKGATGAINTGTYSPIAPPIYDALDPNSQDPAYQQQQQEQVDYAAYRNLLSSQYYDFSVPFNVGFNYSINYNNNGIRKAITQTLGFNISANLTPKWGVTFNSGYDFEAKKMTTGQFVLSRDLHCWQMSFSWVPIGFMKSWSFNISVKSNVLRDLKYDKRSSHYDNFYDK